jgi:hypothetical protein
MTTPIKVLFHQDFVTGSSQSAEFVDLGYMKTLDHGILREWFKKVFKQKKLEGLNKPSWIGRTGLEISSAEPYKLKNLWHYHCGVYADQPGDPVAWTNSSLDVNLLGKTSAAVYHYAKTEGVIIVLAYSPNHKPFPGTDDPNNILVNRSNSLSKVLDISGML